MIQSLPTILDQPLPLGAIDALLPEAANGWIYYSACALFFLLCGLCCGYFVWRKGHMQTIEAEMEVSRTEDELKSLQEEMRLEEQEVNPKGDEEVIDELLSHFGDGDLAAQKHDQKSTS